MPCNAASTSQANVPHHVGAVPVVRPPRSGVNPWSTSAPGRQRSGVRVCDIPPAPDHAKRLRRTDPRPQSIEFAPGGPAYPGASAFGDRSPVLGQFPSCSYFCALLNITHLATPPQWSSRPIRAVSRLPVPMLDAGRVRPCTQLGRPPANDLPTFARALPSGRGWSS